MPKIRAFIALPTSSEAKQKMSAVQAELVATQADVKWEPAAKLHLTLKFLGDCEQDILRALGDELQSTLRDTHSFDLEYQTVGCFPNLNRPRVVWIGAAENAQLSEMQRGIDDLCVRFGFEREDRAFHPHITLGRVKGSRNLDRLTDRVKTITFDSIQARCEEVRIMRSELRPTGSVYTLIHSIPLI